MKALSIKKSAALLGLLLVLMMPKSQAGVLETQPLVFDAGGNRSVLLDQSLPLFPESHYENKLGYGWRVAPKTAFRRDDLERSRNVFDIDGVTGAHLSFQADVPPGRWWVTLFLEAGLEDSATTEFTLNGKPLSPDWQTFRPPAEGRDSWQDIYRVLHNPVDVGRQGITFEAIGRTDSVRLLGIKVYPDPIPTRSSHKELLSELKRLGSFTFAIPLDSLEAGLSEMLTRLNEVLKENPNDAVVRYWRDHLQLFYKAEHYLKMMGWEWATQQTGLDIFDRYHAAVMILDGLLQGWGSEHPLYERGIWQRGRVLYWLWRERGGTSEYASAKRDLSALHQRYPDHKLLAMYNGETIQNDNPCTISPSPSAPEWSTLQLQVLCHLRSIIHWWVNQRQAPNGEFGGKLGDDVELLRAFPPLVLSGDSTAYYGWKRLADRVWYSDKVYQGYAKDPIDVEHASELISDTAPEMVLFSDDPHYLERLSYSARYFKTLWTAKTISGLRLFKSSWFSSTTIRSDPPRNRDVEMNTRAVKAIRYLAWKTRDPEIIKLLYQWSSSWARLAQRTDKGKPVGIIPPSVRFPDAVINGDETTWYQANMYWDYYDWSHNAGCMMLDQLFFVYWLTKDSKLLQPMLASLQGITKFDSSNHTTFQQKGSEAWAARTLMNKSLFWNVVEQWRLHTGNVSFDDLIFQHGTPYARFRLTGNMSYLEQGLIDVLDLIRYNYPLLTREVMHTDRVYPRDGSASLSTFHVNAMLTGCGLMTSPYHAVSWESTGPHFTALVMQNTRDRLLVHVFSHGMFDSDIRMRVWQLEPGSYELKVSSSESVQTQTIKINQPGERLSITLPPQSLVKISCIQK